MKLEDNPVPASADDLLLVGRDHELVSFQKVLKDKQARLVVLTGEPGMGKTSLLRKFRELGDEAGWNTAQLPSSVLRDVETTPDSFSNQLQTLLSVPTGRSFIEKPSKPLVDPTTGQPLLLPIVERLRALAPFLLLIDGYQPGSELAEWFHTIFVNDVRRSSATIVIVLAARPDGAIKITPFADQIIPLGPLDQNSIREHFEELGRQIDPPMKDREIQEYIEAAKEDAEMLDSLTRVLRLALPG
ncbi:MAG: ATP-binding protein [Acidobacteriota bacterium]